MAEQAEKKEEVNKVAEEEKKETEEKKDEEIVLKVDMHCEGCARKVVKSLKGFQGVEGVTTDYMAHEVVVKGKEADPVKVSERIQKKTGKKVVILSPLPKPPEEKVEEEKKEEPPIEEKEEEPPAVITIVLSIRIHCEACAEELQKRIGKIEGVESVTADVANNQVTVKGVLDPDNLAKYVHKKTGKRVSVVKEEEKQTEEEEKQKDEDEKQKIEEQKQKDEEEKEEKQDQKTEENEEDETEMDMKRNEYGPPRHYYYYMEQAYAPQMFSDENPNACTVM